MANLRDFRWDTRFQCLIYGPPKSGKTFGAGTFPRPVVMDFDHGIATLANPEFVKLHGRREIEYEQFTDKDKSKGVAVPATAKAFDDACKYFDKMMSKPHVDNFDTWVIDSGTTLSEAALMKAIVLLGSGQFAGLKSSTHQEALRSGLVFPKIQDYGSERSMVEQFVDMIKDSGKHVVFICHDKEKYNADGMPIGIEPLLTGKGPAAIGLKFDEIYYLQAKKSGAEIKRTLMTQADGLRMAGSRLGLPNGTAWNWESIKAELTKLHAENK